MRYLLYVKIMVVSSLERNQATQRAPNVFVTAIFASRMPSPWCTRKSKYCPLRKYGMQMIKSAAKYPHVKLAALVMNRRSGVCPMGVTACKYRPYSAIGTTRMWWAIQANSFVKWKRFAGFIAATFGMKRGSTFGSTTNSIRKWIAAMSEP